MGRFVTGVLLASVVLYIWGFVFWGFGPYQKLIWMPAAGGEAEAQQNMRQMFPENGVYFIPAHTDDMKAAARNMENGPIAMVHMMAVDGAPMMDRNMMAKGFLVNLGFITLLGLLLLQVRNALPSYFGRLKFVTLAGVASAVLIDLGEIVWWRMSIPWKLYQGVYDATAWLIAGLVLAYFIRPDVQSAAGEEQTV